MWVFFLLMLLLTYNISNNVVTSKSQQKPVLSNVSAFVMTYDQLVEELENHNNGGNAKLRGEYVLGNWIKPYKPAVIVYAYASEDVKSAVRYGTINNMRINVFGSGSSFAAAGLNEGGLVIDVSKMKKIIYDKETHILEIGSGINGLDLDNFTMNVSKGRSIILSSGTFNTVAAWSMAGGWGFLCRSLGLGVDQVKSFEVVTPDGKLVSASDTSHSDLFWALRGAGGGNFGVVVSLKVQTHDLSGQFFGGLRCWHWHEGGRTAAKWMFDNHVNMRRDLDLSYGFEFLPNTRKMQFCLLPFLYNSSVNIQNEFSNWFSNAFPDWIPEVDSIGIYTWLEWQNLVRNIYMGYIPPGIGEPSTIEFAGYYDGNVHNNSLYGDLYLSLFDELESNCAPSGNCSGAAAGDIYGGKVSEVSASSTAFSHRSVTFSYIFTGRATEDKKEFMKYWLQKAKNQTLLYTMGGYIGYVDANYDIPTEDFYGENYERLRRIKKRYDPQNVYWFPSSIDSGV